MRRAVGADLNGWSLVPFSEYSVKVEVAPKVEVTQPQSRANYAM